MFRRLNARVCPKVAARIRARDESGFTLMEAVMAMTLFMIISTALLSVLVSSVSAQRVSRQKTVAEQAITAELEHIRDIPYSEVGNKGGNPDGKVDLVQTVAAVLGVTSPGLVGTVTTKIVWNNDPADKVATSYRNAAYYKKVTITVKRTSDGKVIAQLVTFVADINGGTGVADAEIDVSVVDLGDSTPIANQDVTLTTGPSAAAAYGSQMVDTTDAAGDIVFPALIPNPTSGAQDHYKLSMTPPSGYTLLKDDDVALTPLSANAWIQLAPSQIFPSTLRVYKGSTITFDLKKATNGAAYSGAATVTLSTTLRGTPTNQSFTYTGWPRSTSTFAGENVIPSPSPVISGGYTAAVSNGFYATSVTKATLPNSYPSDLTSTFTLTGYPTGSVQATVTWAGNPVNGATVTLNGGPVAGWGPKTATTNSSGIATFNDVPEGSGYTLSATKSGQTSSSVSATGVAGTTVNVPIAMPVGSVKATVTSAGTPVPGATVTLTGGNISGTITAGATTDVNGQVTVNNVPAGSGVTVTATKAPYSGSTGSVTVNGGSTTNVTVDMPVGTIVVTVAWANSSGASATVTLSGGPLGTPVTGTADATGKITFNNVPPASTYTITATKAGQSASVSPVTVTGGSTTNVTVNLPTGSVVVTATWAGQPVASCTSCATLTGGNLSGTLTGSTNTSGQVTFTNVPYGTMTAAVTRGTGSGSSSVTLSSASQPVTVTLLPVDTLTTTVTWAGDTVSGATVNVTGGPNTGATYSGTTNASGVATITVPVGSGYTVSVPSFNGGTGSTGSVSVPSGGGSATVTLSPTKTVTITVQRGGVNYGSGKVVSVRVTGGPNTGQTYDFLSLTTNASSQVSVVLPQGTGTYTFIVYDCSLASNKRGTNTLSAASGSTAVTVNMNATSPCP